MSDWRRLRAALCLTQREMAELLAIWPGSLRKLESAPHRCPRQQTVRNLRIALQDPEARRRLAAAGYPNPFPLVKPEPKALSEPKPVDRTDKAFDRLVRMLQDG